MDDPHVHRVVLEERGGGYYRALGVELLEGLRQGVELQVALLDGGEPGLAAVGVLDAGEGGVDAALGVGRHLLEDVDEVVGLQQGPVGAGVVVREVDDRREVADVGADVEDLLQGPEHVLLPGDLDPQPGLQAHALPPVDDAAEVRVDVLVHGVAVAALLVDAEAGDHDVAAEGVQDEPGVPDAVHAAVGEVVLAAEVHVVGGVDGELDVHPLGHVADAVELAEGPGDGGGHPHEVVLLLYRLVRVADRLAVPDDLDDEVLRHVADGQADLLLVGGAVVRARADHLHLEGAEAEVVDVLYAVFQSAPLAGQGDAGRAEPYHEPCNPPLVNKGFVPACDSS